MESSREMQRRVCWMERLFTAAADKDERGGTDLSRRGDAGESWETAEYSMTASIGFNSNYRGQVEEGTRADLF